MKKYIKQLKKQAAAILLVVVVVSVLMPVTAAANTQSWQMAYAEILRNNPSYEFALHDMDGDGTPELLLKQENNWENNPLILFTFRNGNFVNLGGIESQWTLAAGIEVEIPNADDVQGVFVSELFSRSASTSLWTLHDGELLKQEVYTFFMHNPDGNFDEWGRTARVIENNVATREYKYISRYYFDNDEYGFTQRDSGFDAASERLAGTPLEFHAVNPANIAAHIYGITVTANSHPFAVELQNIINNLPAGHTFRSATLFNLDERGEQQGVMVLTENPDGAWVRYGAIDKTIIYMVGNDIRRNETNHVGGASNMIYFSLLNNNMLVIFVEGGDASGRYTKIRLHNGELQIIVLEYHSFSDVNVFSDWGPATVEYGLRFGEGVACWSRRFMYYYTIISRNRYEELFRELGLAEFEFEFDWENRLLPDQTAQILAMQAPAAATAAPAPPASVTLDGAPIQFDVPPQIVDNRTLVPLRAIFEAMGATVEWNGDTQTVTATRGNDTVILQVGNHTMTRNGQSVALDVPPRILEGNRTFVPARAVAEAFGAIVGWDGETQTVIITTQ